MNTINSLQHLMACLTTHPYELEKALNNPEYFIQNFSQLSKDDQHAFVNFFKTHAKRFTSATLLLSKKRWEEAELGLEFVMFLFSKQDLENLWKSYVTSYTLTESIPENPLQDSLRFILFIKDKSKLSLILSDLIEYQITKLELLMKVENQDNKIQEFELNNNLLTVNESLISKLFSYKVSSLVRFINQNQALPGNSNDYCLNENIAFYINRRKRTVATIVLNPYLDDLLNTIKSKQNMADCFNALLDKYPLEEALFKNNIKTLNELDLLTMTRK